MNVAVLVVMYKTRLGKSPTIDRLLGMARIPGLNLDVRIWDNSPEKLCAEDLAIIETAGFAYRNTKWNEALSKIYNRLVSECSSHEALILLDQDSCIDSAYFEAVAKSLREHPGVALFLPQVSSSSTGARVSPGKFGYFTGRRWAECTPGIHASKDVAALGSGMVVRPKGLIAKQVEFDEQLSLYGVDSKFMVDYAGAIPELCVLDAKLYHGDSAEEVESLQVKVRRFGNFIRAHHHVMSARNRSPRITWLFGVYLGLKNSWKHGSLQFVWLSCKVPLRIGRHNL